MECPCHFPGYSDTAAKSRTSPRIAPASARAACAFVERFPQPERAYPCAAAHRITFYKFINSGMYRECPLKRLFFVHVPSSKEFNRCRLSLCPAIQGKVIRTAWCIMGSELPSELRRAAPAGDT